MHEEAKELAEGFHITDVTLKEGGFRPIKTMKAYDFGRKPKQYLIDTFQALGWPDPFPKPISTYSGKYHDHSIGVRSDAIESYKAYTKKFNKKLVEEDFLYEAKDINPKRVIQDRKRLEEEKRMREEMARQEHNR